VTSDSPISFRPSEGAREIIDALAERYGITRTLVLEMLAREKGKDGELRMQPAKHKEGESD
jgi:hypothetical protein